MSKAKDKDKPVRFEEAIERLEAIISDIESGQVGLEECIAQYEQGVKLITRCREVLDKAQLRIGELTADAQGRLKAGDASAPDGDGDAADSSDDGDSADEETEADDR